MKLLSLFKKSKFVNQSYELTSPQFLKQYTTNPDFPYLVSFPRTGSHWLRNVMELYFEKPALVRVFYYKNPKDFSCIHVHDEDLSVERQNVIYLHRHPVPTIYSQMNYYQEDLEDKNRVYYWADLYGRHLKKWLLDENFTNKKTVIKYENLKNDFLSEFRKVSDHFDISFEPKKVEEIQSNISRKKIKSKVADNPKVVNLNDGYDQRRGFI